MKYATNIAQREHRVLGNYAPHTVARSPQKCKHPKEPSFTRHDKSEWHPIQHTRKQNTFQTTCTLVNERMTNQWENKELNGNIHAMEEMWTSEGSQGTTIKLPHACNYLILELYTVSAPLLLKIEL